MAKVQVNLQNGHSFMSPEENIENVRRIYGDKIKSLDYPNQEKAIEPTQKTVVHDEVEFIEIKTGKADDTTSQERLDALNSDEDAEAEARLKEKEEANAKLQAEAKAKAEAEAKAKTVTKRAPRKPAKKKGAATAKRKPNQKSK